MLTYRTLDRFEALVDTSTLTAEQIGKIEHAAYCANMGRNGETPEEAEENAWAKFVRIVNDVDHMGLNLDDQSQQDTQPTYNIWDNDNAVLVCSTDSQRDAFEAILNYLIAAHDSEIPDPIMWPVANPDDPENQMPDVAAIQSAWRVINLAKDAYNRISEIIPHT